MNRQERMETALTDAFAPVRLFVINESHLHAGHQPGMDGTGETHFRVRIESDFFTGLSRINRHRAVNDALQGEFELELHALAVETAATGEATRW